MEVRIIECRGDLPLYVKYPSQTNAQDAYVEVCKVNEHITLFAEANPEVGNAVPVSVYSGQAIRLPVPNSLSSEEVNALLQKLAPIVSEAMVDQTINGNGYVNYPLWTEETDAKINALIPDEENNPNPVWDAYDWVDRGDIKKDFEKGKSVESVVAELEDIATASGDRVSGIEECVQTIYGDWILEGITEKEE